MKVFIVACAIIFILIFISLAFVVDGRSVAGQYKSTEEWMQYLNAASIVYPYETKDKALNLQYGDYLNTEFILISSEDNGVDTIEYWTILQHYKNGTDYWQGRIAFSSEYTRDSVPYKAIKSLRSDGQYFKVNT